MSWIFLDFLWSLLLLYIWDHDLMQLQYMLYEIAILLHIGILTHPLYSYTSWYDYLFLIYSHNHLIKSIRHINYPHSFSHSLYLSLLIQFHQYSQSTLFYQWIYFIFHSTLKVIYHQSPVVYSFVKWSSTYHNSNCK